MGFISTTVFIGYQGGPGRCDDAAGGAHNMGRAKVSSLLMKGRGGVEGCRLSCSNKDGWKEGRFVKQWQSYNQILWLAK